MKLLKKRMQRLQKNMVSYLSVVKGTRNIHGFDH
jgi:hypothetical protein